MQYNFSDKRHSRGRYAHLFLVRKTDEKIVEFKGQSIPEFCVVVGDHYTKNGKWSGSDYTIEIPESVSAREFTDGWETGTFREGTGAGNWIECANWFGVSVPVAQEYLRENRPNAAAYYDTLDAELTALENVRAETEVMTFNYGSPTNRQSAEGYWEKSFSVIVGDKVVATISPDHKSSDESVVRVLDVKHSSGYHGGSYSVKIAAPAGARVEMED